MLINLSTALKRANENCQALAALNVFNLETIQAVLVASINLNTPVIVAFGEKYFEHTPIESIAAVIKEAATKCNIDIVLHLDHAKEFSSILRALKCGFTSVMYDGSELPFEINLENTRQIVNLSHAAGVSVEGELGWIGQENADRGVDKGYQYTDSDKAGIFAKITGVDALAIAIGNAHGLYRGEPKLNFDLLVKINNSITCPLVLHGCSGLSEEAISRAVKLGIRKVNINTEMSLHGAKALWKFMKEEYKETTRLDEIFKSPVMEITEVAQKYLRLLNDI